VQRVGRDGRGTRCEIKNLNGVRLMMGALGQPGQTLFLHNPSTHRLVSEHEIERHISLLESSPAQSVRQETRGYDAVTGKTFGLRTKDDAPDYRYMPDPELATLVFPPVSGLKIPVPSNMADLISRCQRTTLPIFREAFQSSLLLPEPAFASSTV
jgi:Asp-tRNA(Asn)/Glu-tRNA(Gln) amidotransferase B subunit